ncbi:hypothetical protein VS868_12040 [Salinimicrobium sp. 3283s]|uniref:hypothetical protein n=1 Tax=Salinimicrobium sp. 3283s TaxID=3114359 RepID=UPI0031ED6D5A
MHDKHNTAGDFIYYRNNSDLESREGIEVEAGSLWKLDPKTNDLILVDDDQYASHPLDEKLFTQE